MIEKNNPKITNAWCFYDWANSPYSLAITSTIFPIYYSGVTANSANDDKVLFFGFEVVNTVLYSYAISFSFLVVMILAPLLSGVADYGGMKKTMMKIFAYLGSASCIALYFFTGENIEFGIIASVLASVGFAGSLVFYNSYLPDIATEDNFDRLSAKGYSLGYIGSVIQLVISLIVTFSYPEDDLFPPRLAFLTVGIWWIGFSQITFLRLPNNPHNRNVDDSNLFQKGFLELKMVWKSFSNQPNTRHFLEAFFFYNMGVQTIMYLAAIFGEKELKIETTGLIISILLIQIVAIGGAYLFAFISKKKGNKFSLQAMIWIWIFICIAAFMTYTENQFYGLAIVVGLVMGGIQSLSRATYSKVIPESTEDTASYFSFYDVTEKLSIVVGTFLYGFIEQLTGSMRYSALTLGLFFVIGLILLSFRFSLKKA